MRRSRAALLRLAAALLILAEGCGDLARADDTDEYQEVGTLNCQVLRPGSHDWIVYSRIAFKCHFDALDETYTGGTRKWGIGLKWNLGENFSLKVFKVKKQPRIALKPGVLAGTYRGMDLGLALGVGGEVWALRGDNKFALQPDPRITLGLGFSWNYGDVKLALSEPRAQF